MDKKTPVNSNKKGVSVQKKNEKQAPAGQIKNVLNIPLQKVKDILNNKTPDKPKSKSADKSKIPVNPKIEKVKPVVNKPPVNDTPEDNFSLDFSKLQAQTSKTAPLKAPPKLGTKTLYAQGKTIQKGRSVKQPPKRRINPLYTTGIIIILSLIFFTTYITSRKAIITGKISDITDTTTSLTSVNITLDDKPSVRNNSVGGYILQDVPSGKHTLVFEKQGYQKKIKEIEVKKGETLKMNILLYPQKLLLSSDTNMLTVSKGNNSLSIVNLENNTVFKSVPTGSAPDSIAVITEMNKIYVSNSGENNISLIDLKSLKEIKKINMENGKAPSTLLLSPGKDKLYVYNPTTGIFSVLDTKTDAFQNSEIVPEKRDGIKAVFINNLNEIIFVYQDSLSVISASGESERKSSPGIFYSTGISAASNNSIFVYNNSTNEILNINTSNFEIDSRIKIEGVPGAITVDNSGNTLYVAFPDSLSILSAGSGQPIKEKVAVGSPISQLKLSPGGNKLYLVSKSSGSILIFDIQKQEVLKTGINVAGIPSSLAFSD